MLCNTKHQLAYALKEITNQGGEGVILRKPSSLYEQGRSMLLFKLKASRGDREALVVAVNEDSYELRLPDGMTFTGSSENAKLGTEPKVGNVVTFTYENFSRRALPVNPQILRIREDVSWEEVLFNHVHDVPQTPLMAEEVRRAGFAPKPTGYWLTEKGKNMIVFFPEVRGPKSLRPPRCRQLVFRSKNANMGNEGRAIGVMSFQRKLNQGLGDTIS